MNKIITISREFGSGGKYIGEEVAGKLNIPFYDKKIIEKIAAETGLVENFVERFFRICSPQKYFCIFICCP